MVKYSKVFISRTTGPFSTNDWIKPFRCRVNFVLWRDIYALYRMKIIAKYIDDIYDDSSVEPLGKFQLNLAQIICGCQEWQNDKMKGHILFQGKIIAKYPSALWKKKIKENNMSTVNRNYVKFMGNT